MSTGLYIGRFQPFHLGHLSAVQQALEQVDHLLIGIGSSQYDHTPDNPFTAKERQTMIKMALKEAGMGGRCSIYWIPDLHNEKEWVEHVKKIVPPFDVVFVGNEGVVKTLFEKAGDRVMRVRREVDVSARQIRQNILDEISWSTHVSKSVADYLLTIQAPTRLKTLLSD